MTICPYCGSNVAKGMTVCFHCGRVVHGGQIFFMPPEDTEMHEEIPDVTEADIDALAKAMKMESVVLEKRLLEANAWKPWEDGRNNLVDYYTYKCNKDKRVKHYRNVKDMAYLGFTFEFYKKMILGTVECFKSNDFGKDCIKQIKRDLKSLRNPETTELANEI